MKIYALRFTLYALLLCLGFACSGCASLFGFSLLSGKHDSDLKDAQAKVAELKEKLGAKDGEVAITKTELEKLKNETLSFMSIKDAAKSLNFRIWSTIKPFVKFVVKGLYEMVIATWLFDLIKIMGLIMLLTWMSNAIGKLLAYLPGIWGVVIKALTFWMLFEKKMKIITSLIWAVIVSALWKWAHAPCDWSYIWVVGAGAVISANVFWEYCLNKTTVSTRAINMSKKLLSPKAIEAFNI